MLGQCLGFGKVQIAVKGFKLDGEIGGPGDGFNLEGQTEKMHGPARGSGKVRVLREFRTGCRAGGPGLYKAVGERRRERDVQVWEAEHTSTVLTSTGGPFAQGEHSLVKCVVYARYSVTEGYLEAPCVATDVSGDRLYMLALRTQGSVEPGTSGAGRFELRGGTGSYAGIRGDCNYETRYITSDRHVTMAECQWRKP